MYNVVHTDLDGKILAEYETEYGMWELIHVLREMRTPGHVYIYLLETDLEGGMTQELMYSAHFS